MRLLDLDRSSQLPLHVQIEKSLRRMLREPQYRDGARLPTEMAMAEHLQVSRNTLRAAMLRLESEGLLKRTRKVGTTVNRKKPHTSLSEWHSFSEEMRRQGITVENYEMSLRRERAGNDIGQALGTDPGVEVWRLRRLRGWEGIPAVLAISWLHPALKITGGEDFRRPLYEVIGGVSNVMPMVSREELSAIAADAPLVDALAVAEGAPILLRKRVVFDASETPIEYNLNYYRTDRYTLAMDLGSTTP